MTIEFWKQLILDKTQDSFGFVWKKAAQRLLIPLCSTKVTRSSVLHTTGYGKSFKRGSTNAKNNSS